MLLAQPLLDGDGQKRKEVRHVGGGDAGKTFERLRIAVGVDQVKVEAQEALGTSAEIAARSDVGSFAANSV